MTGSELQVMVIEDHGFQRRIALRLLAELGIERTLEGADGLHALDVLRRQPSPPDVVLVDLDMPGMDGIECIGQIAQERLARAVVVVSALDPALLNTVQTMASAYGLRVLGSVEKPLTRDDLHALERLHEAGDLPGLTRQAHKIKGAARLVGAQVLADAAAALEAAGRHGDWAGVLPLAADLRTAVEQLRLHVEAHARG